MKKQEREQKKELARMLFFSGIEQKEIAEKTGITEATISKWSNEGGWKESRAAKAITRPELVNKLLLTIDRLIAQVNESEDPSALAGLGDKLSKLASVIEKLDRKASVVDCIEVFMSFSKWLQHRAETDTEISIELIKAINRYQDMYISEVMANSMGGK